MKKIMALTLGALLFVPSIFLFSACGKNPPKPLEVWDGTYVEISEKVNNTIKIDTAEELASFAKSVNEGNSYEGVKIELTCDMDMNNRNWTPIGYGYATYVSENETQIVGKPFNGIFEGNNHTISNLNVVGRNGGSYGSAGVGLFGFVQGLVRNLKIKNAVVTGNQYVGVIAGHVANYDSTLFGEIKNCHVVDSAVNCVYVDGTEHGGKAGAIAGQVAAGVVTNCSAKDVTVKANRDAGQLIGNVVRVEGKDVSTGNTANNVSVSWNQSGGSSENSNTNIKNDLIGKES